MTYNELEKRKDWPVIVTAVGCKECRAPSGEPCKQIGLRQYRGFFQTSNRTDFHTSRKIQAAREWSTHADTKSVEVSEEIDERSTD